MGFLHKSDGAPISVKTNRSNIILEDGRIHEIFNSMTADRYSSPEAFIPIGCLTDISFKSKWSGWFLVFSVRFSDGTMSDEQISESNPYTPGVGITHQGAAKRLVETVKPLLAGDPKPLPDGLRVAFRKKAGIMDEFKSDGRLSMITGTDRSQIVLYSDHISDGGISKPLPGVTASLNNADNARKRVTATRAAAVGVLALAVKKSEPGDHFVIIDGPDFQWSAQVDNPSLSDARKFVTQVNNTVRHYETLHPTAHTDTGESTGPASIDDQLAHLGQLHKSGILDDEEFTTAKHRLLGI